MGEVEKRRNEVGKEVDEGYGRGSQHPPPPVLGKEERRGFVQNDPIGEN